MLVTSPGSGPALAGPDPGGALVIDHLSGPGEAGRRGAGVRHRRGADHRATGQPGDHVGASAVHPALVGLPELLRRVADYQLHRSTGQGGVLDLVLGGGGEPFDLLTALLSGLLGLLFGGLLGRWLIGCGLLRGGLLGGGLLAGFTHHNSLLIHNVMASVCPKKAGSVASTRWTGPMIRSRACSTA